MVDYYIDGKKSKLQINTQFLEEEDANIGVLILIYDIGKLIANEA